MATTLSHTILYQRLGISPEALVSLCQQWQLAELALFGSILRDDFTSQSDIDILVTYQPHAPRGLFAKLFTRLNLLVPNQAPPPFMGH